jgi:hypothetical protein
MYEKGCEPGATCQNCKRLHIDTSAVPEDNCARCNWWALVRFEALGLSDSLK